MPMKLYVVHNSHPCEAVEKALQLKGLEYTVFEWPPPVHALMQRILFGQRTVPAIRSSHEKIAGSRAILHRLDEIVAEPRLYPADPEQRARVEEADRWGDEEFQQIARDLVWVGAVRRPEALVSYSQGSRGVALPAPVVRALAPGIARIIRRINQTDDLKVKRRVAELPGKLDQIDAWIADGTIGDAARPNAADLQILSTVRLIHSFADVRPLLEGRPCVAAAHALWPPVLGELPAGALVTV